MILINAKQEKMTNEVEVGYGLLVILINAKLDKYIKIKELGYGLLVILINAKHSSNLPTLIV